MSLKCICKTTYFGTILQVLGDILSDTWNKKGWWPEEFGRQPFGLVGEGLVVVSGMFFPSSQPFGHFSCGGFVAVFVTNTRKFSP
jgi:hypothetical protein